MTKSLRMIRCINRLARDPSGNAMLIMAASLVPLTILAGSAVDMARVHLVKSRLQQACDAGVLAGRKVMNNSSTGSTLDSNADKQARAFFSNNFRSGWQQADKVNFLPAKTTDSQISATAQATVPMVLMNIFGVQPIKLDVSCQARFDIVDTDVMMVLDVTGSMSGTPSDSANYSSTAVAYTRSGRTDYYNPEKPGSKLQALRDAVMTFYTALRDSAASSQSHIRYGFVPYSSTVNVGAEVYKLDPSYFVDRANYQTRIVSPTAPEVSTSSSGNYSISSSSACASYARPRSPSTGYDASGQATTVTVKYTPSWNGGGTCTITTKTSKPNWLYTRSSWPVGDYLATANWGSIIDPTKVTGATTSWWGCIEERATTPGINSPSGFDISDLPPDLDPDLIPSSDDERWAPWWPDVEYGRYYNTSVQNYTSTANVTTSSEDSSIQNQMASTSMANGFSACPTPASRLKEMTESQVKTYVDGLIAHGGTYHDVGMIWGTRMLSPNGIFKADTQPWPNQPDPQRILVFVTDGAMSPSTRTYGAYGIEYFDGRVSGNGTSVTSANLVDYHNARFLTACSKAKSLNMNIWVIAVGQALTDPMIQCATKPSQAIFSDNSEALKTAFQTIANNVAMLRITK